MTTRRWLVVSLTGLALLLVAGRFLAGVYAEWTWYDAMGALPLYQSRLAHEAALRGGAAIAGFALALANLYAVRSSIVSLVLPRKLANLEIGEAVPGRLLTTLVVVVAVAIAVLLALPQDDWTSLALARLGLPFNEIEPYGDRDVGFYVYRLPLERSLYLCALVAVLVVSAVVVFLYAITPSLRWERGRIYVSAYVRRHLAVLMALVLALIAWSYRLENLSLVSGGSGPGGAFTSFDHRVAAPLLTGLAVGALVAAAIVLWSAWHAYHRVTLAILTLLVLAGPGARAVLPLVARWTTSDADARIKERPYLVTRTLFTRRAFGVDEIVLADASYAGRLTHDALARGVSSWDPAALLRTSEIVSRGLSPAALAWLPSPGGLTAAIAQRPAGGAGAWALSSADATTADERGRALPRLAEPIAMIERAMPAVLVEEAAAPYAVLADSTGRLPAPSFTTWWERLAHAWHLQNPRLLAMELPEPRPRIVFHRDVRDRIRALAPFFVIGPTIQAMVRSDSLYWIADLFTASVDYPLAETVLFAGEPRRYVRHAATAVVQAQTGRVTLVADRRPDAIARSWMRRFPSLFAPREALPGGLAEVRPPSVDWAAVQGAALARAGFAGDTNPPRALAHADDADADLAGGGPTLHATSGDRGPLAWSVGLLDDGDRVLGALVARGGDAPRTEWHRARPALRWSEVLERLQQGADDAGIGRQRRHSRRGRVQVLPAPGGLIYTQSFYEWPPDAPPALAGVVVLERGETRSGATLSLALGLKRAPPAGAGASFRSRVTALYAAMSDALRRGDWRAFGEAYAALGRLLRGEGR